MRVLKPTKVQKFNFLKNTTNVPTKLGILSSCEDYKQLKEVLVHLLNKNYCLLSQDESKARWYLGKTYFTSNNKLRDVNDNVFQIAEELGYQLYSPNGAWFIKSY